MLKNMFELKGGVIKNCNSFIDILSIGFEFEVSNAFLLIENNKKLYTLAKIDIIKDTLDHSIISKRIEDRFIDSYRYNYEINENYNFSITDDIGYSGPINDFITNNDELKLVIKENNTNISEIVIGKHLPNIEFHILFDKLGKDISKDIIYNKFIESCKILNNHFENFKKYNYYLVNNRGEKFNSFIYKNDIKKISYAMKAKDKDKNDEELFILAPQTTITCKLENTIGILKCFLKESDDENIFNEIIKYSQNIIKNMGLTVKLNDYKILNDDIKYKLYECIINFKNYKKEIININDIKYKNLLDQLDNEMLLCTWIILSLYEFVIFNKANKLLSNGLLESFTYYKNICSFIIRHDIYEIFNSSIKTQIPNINNLFTQHKNKTNVFTNFIYNHKNIYFDLTYNEILDYLINSTSTNIKLEFNGSYIKNYTTMFNYNNNIVFIELRDFQRNITDLHPFNLKKIKKFANYYKYVTEPAVQSTVSTAKTEPVVQSITTPEPSVQSSTKTKQSILFVPTIQSIPTISFVPTIQSIQTTQTIQFSPINQSMQVPQQVITTITQLPILNKVKNKISEPVTKVENKMSDELYKNCLDNINSFINNISLDDVLKPAYFFKETVDNDTYFNVTNNDDNGILSNELKDDNVNGENDNENNSNFNKKKIFYNLLTDLISNEVIYNDSKQDLIFLFQYLVNTLFNKLIKEYNKRISLNKTSFLYKGGTVIQILYKKYLVLFNNNSFLLDYGDNFKRSDSDYAININKESVDDFENFQKIYRDMNILTYNVLEQIKNYLVDTPSGKVILPLDSITIDDLKNKLNKINDTLIVKKNDLSLFENVDKFIGISLNDIFYMEEDIKGQLENFDNDDENTSNLKYNDNKLTISRKGFYISAFYDNTNKKYISKTIMINPKNNLPNKKGIYNYFNQTNKFRGNHFTLHRIKINSILYLKYKEINGVVKYGYMRCPAELIDIPISKYDDKKLVKSDFIIYKNYKYFNTNLNQELSFKSYNLQGFILDLLITFEEPSYPWKIDKYEKKIRRFILFVLLYLYNLLFKDNKKILVEFCLDYTKILYYYQNRIKNIDFNSLISKYSQIFNDKLLNKCFIYFDKINNMNKTDNSIEVNQNYTIMIKLVIDIFLKFNTFIIDSKEYILTNFDKDNEYVPYLTKYLKYKQKYINLNKYLHSK